MLPMPVHGGIRAVRNWRVCAPTLILVAVALVQVSLTKVADLSPWKGGGFGMFATTDGGGYRHVRIVVEAPGRSEEVAVAPSLRTAAARAALMPAPALLTQLARAVVVRERRHGQPVTTVRIEVWRVDFDSGMAANERRLRTFVYQVR